MGIFRGKEKTGNRARRELELRERLGGGDMGEVTAVMGVI